MARKILSFEEYSNNVTNEGKARRGAADRHQEKIAKDTVKNPNKSLLGGPSPEEAEDILRNKFGYSDAQIEKLKESYDEEADELYGEEGSEESGDDEDDGGDDAGEEDEGDEEDGDDDDGDDDDDDDDDEDEESEEVKPASEMLKEVYESACNEAKAYESDEYQEHTVESYMKEMATLNAGMMAEMYESACEGVKEGEMTVEMYEAACNEMKEAYAKKMDEMMEAYGGSETETE